MAPTRFNAVIFDLDGTLVDTEVLCNETGEAACRSLGHPVSPGFFETLAGIDDETRAEMIARHTGRPVDTAQFFAEWDRLCIERFRLGVPLKPGVPEVFDRLRSAGLPLAICTSSRRNMAEAKVAAAGFAACFDAIISVNDVPHAKPHPAPYLTAARALGVELDGLAERVFRPEKALAVEDSDTGVASAIAAGMTVLQVPDLHPPKSQAATLIAPTIAEGLVALGL